jgi:ATP-binding protein involved in chromosome partitioning
MTAPSKPTTPITEAAAREAARAVTDPGLDRDLGTLRMVKAVALSGSDVAVEIELPTPAYAQALRSELRVRLEDSLRTLGAGRVDVKFSAVTAFRPAPSEKARVPGVKNIIAVAAGKGGVGKSTVATNLALALKAHGASVGLLDADIFGPSIPQMMGPPQQAAGTTTGQKIIPAVHHDVKVISIGFFVDRNEAVVWRGPMVHRLLQQWISTTWSATCRPGPATPSSRSRSSSRSPAPSWSPPRSRCR